MGQEDSGSATWGWYEEKEGKIFHDFGVHSMNYHEDKGHGGVLSYDCTVVLLLEDCDMHDSLVISGGTLFRLTEATYFGPRDSE